MKYHMGMDNYHIATMGNGFQVVEMLPDGRHSTVDGFGTRDDAQRWLDSFTLLLGLVSCLAGESPPD
jgi:hypothetical protein